MKIDEKKSEPKYLQLKNIFKRYFNDNHYEAGQKIPSETELIEQFHVSRNTVRQALAELVNEGLVYKKHGSGSFFSGKTREIENRSHLIGVITPIITSYIYAQIIQGIDDVAHQKRYNIVLGSTTGSSEKELSCLEQLLEKNIEGLLIEPSTGFQDVQESKTFHFLKTLSIPVVIMDWAIDDSELSYVAPNDLDGGFKATQYLIKAGHKRIACLYPHDHIPALQRYKGYRKALETYGIEHDSRLEKSITVHRWHEIEQIHAMVQELLALGTQGPSAMFFFNDEAALRGYGAIRQAGFKIPDDISMIGFDDSELALLADVPLTSVAHPKYDLGKWAAEILFDAIENTGQRTTKHLLLNSNITVRKSVKFV